MFKSLFPGVSFVVGVVSCLFSLKCLFQTTCNTEIRHCSDVYFCRGKKLGISFFSEIWGSQQYLILFVDFLWIPGRAVNSKRGTSFLTDWSLKLKASYNEISHNIQVSWQCFVKGNVINSKRNQETIVTNVWVFAFFNDKTINFNGMEEKHTYRYLNIRWKVLKEIFAALLGKFYAVANNSSNNKKWREISVLQGRDLKMPN